MKILAIFFLAVFMGGCSEQKDYSDSIDNLNEEIAYLKECLRISNDDSYRRKKEYERYVGEIKY